MEKYKVIDMEHFKRADYFQSYILFKLFKMMNLIENFRLDIVDGKLVEWDRIVPTFLSFNQNTKLFFTLYADIKENYPDYDLQYKQTVQKYANAQTIVPQGTLPPNVFNVSCIPWLHFEHFSSNSKMQETQIVKMITLGKYESIKEKVICPLTIQVAHAIADGYHVALFFEKLQEELNVV